MTKTNYPNLTFETVFDVYNVGQNMKRESNYLEESPYPDMVRKTLLRIFANEQRQQPQPAVSMIKLADLNIQQETEFLYLETKNLLNARNLDEKDKAAIVKTATSQMEKLITLIERAHSLKDIRDFEVKVLRALKKVAPEVRDQFLEEIERLEKEDGKIIS